MNFLDLPWEIILIILKQYNDYKYCIRLLMICKQLYDNELLMKEIKDHFTEHRVDKYETQSWYFNGKYHRDNDKPAIIFMSGHQYWYLNGKYHREGDNPAIIKPNGYQAWYLNGKRHRENGPAIIYSNGELRWYLNDKLHRENDPAIIYPDGDKSWYLNDKRYTEKEYWEEIDKINSLKN